MIPIGAKVRFSGWCEEDPNWGKDVYTVTGVLTGRAVTVHFDNAPDPCYILEDINGEILECIAENQIEEIKYPNDTIRSLSGSFIKMKLYYILSLKWSPQNNRAVWWRPNGLGRTTDLSQAGLFLGDSIEKLGWNNGVTTKAIPKEEAEKMAVLSVNFEDAVQFIEREKAGVTLI